MIENLRCRWHGGFRGRASAGVLAVLVLLASGCVPGGGGIHTQEDPHADAVRNVELRFSLDDSIRGDLDRPAHGIVRGNLYRTEDVGAFGPSDSAVPLASIDPTAVDLTDKQVSEAYWRSKTLPAGKVTFLGYVDLDRSGGDDPDDGEPVTLPATNRFELRQDTALLQVTISFDYVKGSLGF